MASNHTRLTAAAGGFILLFPVYFFGVLTRCVASALQVESDGLVVLVSYPHEPMRRPRSGFHASTAQWELPLPRIAPQAKKNLLLRRRAVKKSHKGIFVQ